MKRLLSGFICAVALLAAVSSQAATQTWIVIGDSILSSVPQGTASQMALNLVSNERDVIFKSIASPGAALGIADNTGFNSTSTTATLDHIAGAWLAYNGILIQAGVNDYNRNVTWQAMVDSLRRIMNHARALNKKVLVLDPIWRAGEDVPNGAGNTLNTYRFFMSVVCTQEYADICRFAHRENTVMGTSAGAANYDANEVATGTQLHPNVTGHRKLADWIKAEAAAVGFF